MPVAVGDAVAYAGHAQGVVGDGGERQYPAEQGAEEGAVYAALTYDKDLTYYQANGTPLNVELFEDGVTAIPDGAYYLENTTATTTEFKYVNSDDIPVAYTEMSISFTAGKVNP